MNRLELKKQLVLDEGLRLKPYTDTVGKWTIGVGRNLTDVGLSNAEADYLLDNDVATVEHTLDGAVPEWRTLSDKRQQVIANMCFNMGIVRLVGFAMMWHAIGQHDYIGAAREMLASKWADQVGARAHRLADAMKEG